MKDLSIEIAQLCEEGRAEAEDAAAVQRHAARLLRLLGWEMPLPFSPRESAQAIGAQPYLLRAAAQTHIAAYFVPAGCLDPPSRVVSFGLDFCPAAKALTIEARACSVHYVLITDFHRSYFYDPHTEELLLYADDPAGFNALIAPVLRREAAAAGALDEVRRAPRSLVARQLRDWCERWTDAFIHDAGLREDDAWELIDRFLVLGFLFDREILRRTKWRLQQRFLALVERAESGRAAGVGEGLLKLFYDMGFDWRMDLFAPNPELEQALRDDAIAAPLLREFDRLSRNKFALAAILERFNCGDPAEKMRVRMVAEDNEERERYLQRQSLASIDRARIEVDLCEEGYRAMFHWFDKVVALYERLEVDFDARTYRNVPAAQELDLFSWGDMDAGRPSACGDKLAYACEYGFGAYYASPRQLRTARLMLTLHLIDRYDRSQMPVERFPNFARVFMERPKVLTSQFVMRATASMALHERRSPRAG